MNAAGSKGNRVNSQNTLTLPWDLGEWVDPSLLLSWVTEEVNRLDWANPKLQEYLHKNPAYRPRLLLCLLTWAYATALFGSQAISEACYREEFLLGLCDGKPPLDNAIARFRRDNRGLLKWSLIQLFKRVLRNKYQLADSFWPAGVTRHLAEAAVQRLDLARQIDRGSSGF